MLASTEFVRAGKWVFGTGLRERNPHKLFERIAFRLDALGSSMSLVARLDQYYPHARCVAPYQAARKRAFERRQVAPSTSVIASGLQDPQAEFDVQVVAATAESGLVPEEIGAGLNRPETSGYAPCLRVGDLVFVAGQLARDGSGALAARGTAEETDYIFRERLLPALEAADSGPDLVLKAQVYLSENLSGNGALSRFHTVWSKAFEGGVPPTTVVAVRHPAFLTTEATVEVNLIAARRAAGSRVHRFGRGEAHASMLDGLLFVGGLGGADLDEVVEKARPVFAEAGAELSNVVRALVFHAGRRGIAEAKLPFRFTAVEVQAGLTIDLWGYVPQP
ncbi:MAG TPA: RidA family protein [Burkholderiales bacterium]|nr:RidA family protein [Burkholderiales bacterium]